MRASGALRVDGVLDEADWARATPITGFRLIQNREGEAPSESTEVRVLFDGTHLYFGCRCWNRGPGAIRASLAPRDQILDLDNLGIQLDPYRDRHRAFTFGVNPYGVQFDGIFIGDELDTQWDGVWDAEATRDSAGWTAELAIPLRTLRFPEHGDGVVGAVDPPPDPEERRGLLLAALPPGRGRRRHAAGGRPHGARRPPGQRPARPAAVRGLGLVLAARVRRRRAGRGLGAPSAGPTWGSTRACRCPPRSRSTRP